MTTTTHLSEVQGTLLVHSNLFDLQVRRRESDGLCTVYLNGSVYFFGNEGECCTFVFHNASKAAEVLKYKGKAWVVNGQLETISFINELTATLKAFGDDSVLAQLCATRAHMGPIRRHRVLEFIKTYATL